MLNTNYFHTAPKSKLPFSSYEEEGNFIYEFLNSLSWGYSTIDKGWFLEYCSWDSNSQKSFSKNQKHIVESADDRMLQTSNGIMAYSVMLSPKVRYISFYRESEVSKVQCNTMQDGQIFPPIVFCIMNRKPALLDNWMQSHKHRLTSCVVPNTWWSCTAFTWCEKPAAKIHFSCTDMPVSVPHIN